MTGRDGGKQATDTATTAVTADETVVGTPSHDGGGDTLDHTAERDSAPTQQRGDPAVSVRGLSKQFGSGGTAVTAVDDVSVDIATGSIVGLLGPNGAGKTTLIKSILGMVLPDEGTVTIRGIDVHDQPRRAYAHVDAMLEGARNDYWRLTVRENLRYFATISGIDPNSVADRHDRLLEALELEDKAETPVRDLSRGMKQKVSLASVLAGGAEVVFLDEPTLGLDIESSRTLQQELRRLAADQGLTVVLSSHDMHVVETVCDRVLIMSDGQLVADDTVDALLRGGATDTVRIASTDLTPAVVDRLDEQFAVTTVELVDRGGRIEVALEDDELYAMMDHLRDAGVTIDRIASVEPDLEDVFVDVTNSDADA